MHLRASVAALAASSLFVSAASAQISPGGFSRGVHLFSQHTAPMKRTVALDLLGDARPDVLTQVGQRLLLCFSPGIYNDCQVVRIGSADLMATDVVAVPGGGWDGYDGFVISDAAPHPSLLSFHLDTAQFSSTALPGSGWEHATELRVGDVDGDGAADLVGVAADGITLLGLSDVLGAAVPFSDNWGSPITSMKLIEWDGTPGLELAMLSGAGISVSEHDGTAVHLLVPASATDRIEPISEAGSPHDKLAFLAQYGSYHWLYTISPLSWDPQVLLGPTTLTETVSGDYDGNGNQDLLISHQTDKRLIFMLNQTPVPAATFSWGAGVSDLIDLTLDGSGADPAPENQAHPTLADLDMDGDGDIFHPIQSEGRAAMSLTNLGSPVSDGGASLIDGEYRWSWSTNEGRMTLNLTASTTDPDPSMDKTLAVVWRQERNTNVEPVAMEFQVLARTDPYQFVFTSTDPIDSGVIHHVELRPVELDVNNRILQTGAASVLAFTADEAQVAYLESQLGAGTAIPLTTDVEGPASEEGSRVVPLVCLPDFIEDDYQPPLDGR